MSTQIDTEHDVIRLRQSIARIARSLRTGDAGSGLTPTQSSLLASVSRHGPVGLSDLCRIEGLNATLLSRTISTLEGRGLIERRRDPADGRAAQVGMTPAGRRLLRRLRAERADALRRQLARLEPHELQRLLEAIPVLEVLAERLLEGAE